VLTDLNGVVLESDYRAYPLVTLPGGGKDIAPRIAWLRQQRPEQYARARWLLDCKEAVVMFFPTPNGPLVPAATKR
jgi:hypothetical protein